MLFGSMGIAAAPVPDLRRWSICARAWGAMVALVVAAGFLAS